MSDTDTNGARKVTRPAAGRNEPAARTVDSDRTVEARIQDAIGETADHAIAAVSRISEQATASVTRISDQGKELLDQASDRAHKIADTVDPFVKDQPYAAMGMVAIVGLLLGLLLGGPKVIYVKSRL